MSKSLLIIDANVKFQNVVSKTPHRGRYDNGYNQDGYVAFEYYYSLETSFAKQLADLELLYSSNTEDDTVIKQLLAHNVKPIDGVSDGQANLVKRDVESVGQKQKMHSVIDAAEYDKVFRIIAPLPLCSVKQMYVNAETGKLIDKKLFKREVLKGDGIVELHTADDTEAVNAKSDTFVRIWASSYELNKTTLAPTDINSITEKMSDVITQDDADHYEQPPFESLLKFLSWRTKFHSKRYETHDVYYVMDWTPAEDDLTHEGIIPTKQKCVSYKEAINIVKEWKRELLRQREILFNRRYVQVAEHHTVPGERYEVRIEVMPGAPVKYANVSIMGHSLRVFKGQPFVLYAAVAQAEKHPNAFMRTESRIMKGTSVMRMFNESFWRY